MNKKHCKNCKWWDEHFPKAEIGSCRRYPPILIGMDTKVDVADKTAYSPNTVSAEWCGEWKEK